MGNSYGLIDKDFLEIKHVMERFPEVDEVILFGSRAKGNFKIGSDVDLALKGTDLDFNTVVKISYCLNEETQMPYKFDVLHFDKIKEAALLEHINRVGKRIFSKANPSMELSS